MTLTELSPNGQRYSDAEARAGALAALRTDPQLTGEALGTMFPRLDGATRSGEWGRKMKRRHAVPVPAAVSGTGNGTSSGTTPASARRNTAATGSRTATVPKTKGVPATRRLDRWQTAVTVVVGAVAAAWSAGHTIHLAQMAGAGRWSYVTPVVIDGLIFVCARHIRTVDGYWVAKLGLALGIAGTVAANVIAVDPSLVDLRYVLRVLAVAAPVAFIVCAHLLERGAR